MALSNNGITISLVRDTIGENTNDLGQLCTSDNVNKWSFWKPVSANKVTMNSDDDFFAVDDGFNVTSYSSPMALWNAIINEETWQYQKPEGGATSRYRLGDFRYYDHYTGEWFSWNFTNTGQAEKGESRPIENSGSKDLAWIYNNFNSFSWVNPNGQDNAVLGLLLNNTWTGSSQGVYFYRICSTLDYDSERIPFTIPDDLNVYDTTYKFVPCITTYASGQDGDTSYFTESNWQGGSTWWPLPSNVFSLYLKDETWTPTPAFSLYVDIDTINFDYASYAIDNLEGTITFTISAAKTYPITIGATIYYENSPSRVTVYSVGGTIAAGDTTLTCSFNHKETITVVADLKEEDQLTFTVETTYSYLGYSFNQTDSVIGYKS